MSTQISCSYISETPHKTNVEDWWPKKLNLQLLSQNCPLRNPMDSGFDYAEEFNSLDLEEVVYDLNFLMTDSQDWWPADNGHYGPFFIRMAWHSAGTYRIADGRGGASTGAQRFAPLSSWPDNINLDKARRLLWPIKQKYGIKLSWADLIILAGTIALQSMGLKILGFAGGRSDAWCADQVDWGSERKWLADDRYKGDRELANPLAAVQMGLIYVNPEGPNGVPDPVASARDIRETFNRMSMNDEETVALIAGGHTFGQTHGAASPAKYIGPEPEAAPLEQQGLGWKNTFKTGSGVDTISSGLEGAWTTHPTSWDGDYFNNLFDYEWVPSKSPAGAHQWVIKENSNLSDPNDNPNSHQSVMLTTDLALKMDPAYAKISKRFHNNPLELANSFSNAWYKLTHRDMGPFTRYLGSMVPKEQFSWQDPIPMHVGEVIDEADIANIKRKILSSGLSVSQLVKTAWASAVTFRAGDKRGGANGARIRLFPQKDWIINQPLELKNTLKVFESIQSVFNSNASNLKKVSMADLIVLGGCVAIQEAAKKGGYDFQVPFIPGRMDASQEQTDIVSFSVLEPKSDGFRNYVGLCDVECSITLLLDTANQLMLTPPEMTVLIGGLRTLNANYNNSMIGVLTNRTDTLSNDFFINLLDMHTFWSQSSSIGIFEGRNRKSSELKWVASRVDLIFGSDSELRAIAEVYGSNDSAEKFVKDFIKAWVKVMSLDRF